MTSGDERQCEVFHPVVERDPPYALAAGFAVTLQVHIGDAAPGPLGGWTFREKEELARGGPSFSLFLWLPTHC